MFWKANLLAFQNNTLKKTIFEYRIISRKSSLGSKGFWFWGLCLFFCMFVGWLVGFWFFEDKIKNVLLLKAFIFLCYLPFSFCGVTFVFHHLLLKPNEKYEKGKKK